MGERIERGNILRWWCVQFSLFTEIIRIQLAHISRFRMKYDRPNPCILSRSSIMISRCCMMHRSPQDGMYHVDVFGLVESAQSWIISH
jgi:hypothetical protein